MATPEFYKGEIEITFDALRKIREQQGSYALKDVEEEFKIGRAFAYKVADANLENTKVNEEALRKIANVPGEAEVSTSALNVTATNILFMAIRMMRDSTNIFRTRQLTGIASFDMGRGLSSLMIGLLDEDLIFRNPRHVSDQGELLRLQSINELFRDPTGLSYVEKAVESWGRAQPSRGGMIEPYEVREAVIDGVKMGVYVYKRMHPIAEKVLSSGR